LRCVKSCVAYSSPQTSCVYSSLQTRGTTRIPELVDGQQARGLDEMNMQVAAERRARPERAQHGIPTEVDGKGILEAAPLRRRRTVSDIYAERSLSKNASMLFTKVLGQHLPCWESVKPHSGYRMGPISGFVAQSCSLASGKKSALSAQQPACNPRTQYWHRARPVLGSPHHAVGSRGMLLENEGVCHLPWQRTACFYSAQQAHQHMSLGGMRERSCTKHFAPRTSLESSSGRRSAARRG